jgi:LuxR family maltose regulon positive regulatory protein
MTSRASQAAAEQLGGFGASDARSLPGSAAGWPLWTIASTPLTERERAVLSLLSSPGSLEELAAHLTVSVDTVKTHVRAIYAKLGSTGGEPPWWLAGNSA